MSRFFMEESSFQILYFWPPCTQFSQRMKILSAFFHRHASWRTLGIAFVAYLLFSALLLPQAEQTINRAAGREVGIIDLGIGFDLEKMKQQVADYGETGRRYYRRTEMTLDVLYPLAYAAFFSLMLSLLMRGLPLGEGWQRWNVLPFVVVAFDYLENIFLVMMLSAYPDWNETTALLCAVFRFLKWILFAAMGVLILYLIGWRLLRRLAVT